MIRITLLSVLWLVGFVLIVTTILPLSASKIWWIRVWDFPRLHIAVLILTVIALAAVIPVPRKPWLILPLVVAFIYQAIKIYPYTPLAPTELALHDAPENGRAISAIAMNVLMGNTRYGEVAAMIEAENPDIVFLMETNQAWAAGLDEFLKQYTHVEKSLSDDHYGLIFATNLPVDSFELTYPIDGRTPAVKAILKAPDGQNFNFIGLHPRPPVPGHDTEERDRQIKNAAEMTASSARPTVAMGDFNAVAWSRTTQNFKRYGNFLEPRVGRGLYSSFDAKHPLLRFPIDQLFVTDDVRLISFDRLDNAGSDHFPILARFFFDTE